MSVDIHLQRSTRKYKDGEVVAGTIVIESKGECSHQGVMLTGDGAVSLQLSSKNVGVFESFYNSVKPIILLSKALEIAKPGKFPSGITEIPFEIPLVAKGNKKLYETYHGVFISIQYMLKLSMKRGMLNRDLHKELEFLVEMSGSDKKVAPEPKDFIISPEALTNAAERANDVPKFKIEGRLNNLNCNLLEPFSGELVVKHCSAPIKSIELQLLRVETCGCADGYAKEATEIQNIQIVDGEPCFNISIPIYMIFPRLFTAPTLATPNFKIDFEVNIVIIFGGDKIVTENFPITISR